MGFVLREFAFEHVDEVDDGNGVVRKLLELQYDLVLLNVTLDGVTQAELFNVFKRLTPPERRVIVLLATQPGAALVEEANSLGVANVTSVPVQAFALREAVRQVLGSQAAHLSDDERRAVPRLRVRVQATLSAYPGRTFSTFDISPFGAFFECADLPKVGENLKVSLTLPHVAAPLHIDAVVVHIRAMAVEDQPAGFGVSFAPGSSEQLQTLALAFQSPR